MRTDAWHEAAPIGDPRQRPPSSVPVRLRPPPSVFVLILASTLLGALQPAAAQPIPDTPRLRWEFFYQKRAYPFDRIPAGAVARARSQAAALQSNLFLAPPPIAGSQWTSIGPEGIPINTRAIGRLTAIAVHPSDPNTIYVGGAQGGVWKTTNGGTSWIPTTDGECSLAMGWIAIDPVDPNIIYAGTGEQHFSGDSYYGCGLLRSTDGGANWTQLGGSVFQTSTGGARISRVVIDPSTAGTVATTRLYVASDFGLYVSTDGGASFTLSRSGLATDVVMDPTDPAVLYAAIYNTGVYKTVNSGTAWTLMPTGFATSMRRINLAIAPSAPDTLYASVQSSGSDLAGIWRTTDGAVTWSKSTATNASCGNQCWYDMAIAVDPSNPNIVYFGGVTLYKSTDGAGSFSDILGGIHVDQHVLAFAPSDAGQLFVGNDGGIYKSTNAGGSWGNLNTNLVLTQFYEGISLHPFDPQIVMGGTQDNGTLSYSGLPTWSHVLGGDGGYTAIDQDNPTTRYAETQWAVSSGYSGPRRSDGGGYSLKLNGISAADRALFIPPLVMDQVDSDVLYFGTYRVYRTADRGETWSAISGDLTRGTGAVSAIAPALADPLVIYVGTSDGLVQTTTDGGQNWTQRSLPLSSFRYVQDIAVDPRDPQTAYVVVSGFLTPHVLRTTDGGASFTNVSGSLPDTPVNAVVVDPTSRGTVLIGTDVGAYMSTDSGGTWSPLANGMPNVAIFDIAYNANTGTLIAATHGRGMFQLQLDRPLTLAVVGGARNDSALVGATNARLDSAVVILSGTNGATTAWAATHTAASWISLTSAAGTGTDRLRWTRDPTGLAEGVYVDTITVSATGAIDSPWLIVDSLLIQSALTLAVTPGSRADTVIAGATAAVPDSADVLITGAGAAAAAWTASHGAAGWLTLTAANGTGSGVVRWDRDPTGLAAGVYVDTIAVSVAGALGSPARVIDTLVIRAALALAVAPTSRSDTALAGATAILPDSADVLLTGVGATATAWAATHGAGAWLALTTAAGTGSGVVRWDRDPTGLAVGVYVDTITVTAAGASGSPAELVDSLVVQQPLTLTLTPASRVDTVVVGSTAPTTDSADVLLSGLGAAAAAWTATPLAGTWLTLTTAAGTGSGTVRWQRDPTGLAVGWYVDTIAVTAPGAVGSPRVLVDSLLVREQPAALALDPTGRRDSLSVGAAGPQPDSASVSLTGLGADTTQWTASHGAAGWLALTTPSGTASGMVRWARNATGLATGTYVDTIRVTTSQGEMGEIHDTLEVIPAPLAVASQSRRGAADAGSIATVQDSVALVLRGVGNTTATWNATHGSGSWLTFTAGNGTGSGTVRWTRSPAGLRPGTYVDTVRVVTSRADTAAVIDTLVLTAPAVATNCAATELLTPGCLSDVQKRYLDLEGNVDGTYNLGDLVALLQRTAGILASERRP